MSEPSFSRTDTPLSMTCRVEISIGAGADVVWRILTDAHGFPRWNSTVTGIEGKISDGERLKISAPGAKRVFTPKVSAVRPKQGMVWSEGFAPLFKGVRTFALQPTSAAMTDFVMEERFSGVMFALAKGAMPDFRPIFEAYARDLKGEAERQVSKG